MTIPAIEPNFVRQSNVIFSYPYNTPTETIIVKNPALGNIERISVGRIQGETRGGDIFVYRKSTWPKDDELPLTFTNLTNEEKQAIQNFVSLTLGKKFKYTDHLGLVWEAIITNPETQYVCDDERNMRWTVNLTLNVELKSWP